MTERKFTDEEVIKALSTVSYGGHSCEKCKFEISKGDDRCGLKGCNICRLAIDLINRKNAEIERLNAVSEICGDCHKQYAEKIEKAKSEAIKEFADRLRKYYDSYDDYEDIYAHNIRDDIDFLVKEMTEEQS